MSRTHWGQHGDECFGCKVLSVQISPAATPTRTGSYKTAPRAPNNSYEKGVPTDERGMPWLLPGTLDPAGQKYVDQHRHLIEENRRKARATPPQPE